MGIRLALTLVISTVALAEPPAAIVQWRQSHPPASEAFAAWIDGNRESARPIFHWARAHPLRAQTFIKWLVDHPKQGLDDFMASHSEWPAVEMVMKPHRAAMEAFVRWAVEHPAAANDLAAVPHGLAALGFHVFRDRWDNEAGR